MAAQKFRDELIATAAAIAAPGKGILAADESTNTIGQRFVKIGVENTEPNRRAYRDLLFTTPAPWEQHISGVILFEETLYQKTEDGTLFVDVMKKRGVVPGIKVDKGTAGIPGCPGETSTFGLDGLAQRCQDYYKAGARFAKWRAVISIPENGPTDAAIFANAHGLARYAAICQENGLMPIVEPEILMDGTHTIERCAEVTEKVMVIVFEQLSLNKVLLEGILLKPNMVTAGKEHPSYKTTTPEQVAHATITVLQRTVPAAVKGIMFLSGGQSEEEATLNLQALNSHPGPKPWSLSFSYGRALQKTALDVWKGQTANVPAAQDAWLHRAKCNGEANLGKYVHSADTAKSAGADLYEKGYRY